MDKRLEGLLGITEMEIAVDWLISKKCEDNLIGFRAGEVENIISGNVVSGLFLLVHYKLIEPHFMYHSEFQASNKLIDILNSKGFNLKYSETVDEYFSKLAIL